MGRCAQRHPPPAVGDRATVTGRVLDDAGLTTVALEGVSDDGRYAGSIEAVRRPSRRSGRGGRVPRVAEGMLVALAVARGGRDRRRRARWVVPDSSGVTRLFRGDADGRKLGLAAPEAWLLANQGDA